MDVVFADLIAKFGPSGLLAAFMIALITGRLITLSWHRERIADKDAQIAYLRATLDKRDEQFNRLLEGQQVTVRLLEDLKAHAGVPGAVARSGGSG